MKLKTSFKILIANIAVFTIGSVYVLYEIDKLHAENNELKALIHMSNEKTIDEPQCDPDKTVVYDVESLHQVLNTASDQVLKEPE